MSLSPAELDNLEGLIAAAARGAGEIISRAAGTSASLVWESKGTADFVSDVDRAAEASIVRALEAGAPGSRVMGEEFSPANDKPDGLVFMVDPLDGTTNFLHGFPRYAVSIGAVMDGEPVAGAILNVPTGELFTAASGRGAKRDGEPISVSRITAPALALIGTGFPFKELGNLPRFLEQFTLVTKQVAGIRRPGSAALDFADVACGRFDSFWELGLSPWDVAAGILLVREAGGVVTDLQGAAATPGSGNFVAGNAAIHAWLVATLRSAHAG